MSLGHILFLVSYYDSSELYTKFFNMMFDQRVKLLYVPKWNWISNIFSKEQKQDQMVACLTGIQQRLEKKEVNGPHKFFRNASESLQYHSQGMICNYKATWLQTELQKRTQNYFSWAER